MDGTDGSWVIVGEAYEDLGVASDGAILAARVDVEHRDAVTLLLNRLNQNPVLGVWSLDPEDGEVQFKTAIDFGGFAPTLSRLNASLQRTTVTYELAVGHADGLGRLCFVPGAG